MIHAEIPCLPKHLWQAAFFMDLVGRQIEHQNAFGGRASEEVLSQASAIEDECHAVGRYLEFLEAWLPRESYVRTIATR